MPYWSFTGEVAADKQLLTETAFSILQVPASADEAGLYGRLSVQDGVIIVDKGGRIIYADDTAEKIMRLRGRTSPLKGESVFTDFADLSAARHALVTRQGTTEEINSPESSLTFKGYSSCARRKTLSAGSRLNGTDGNKKKRRRTASKAFGY